MVAVHNSLNIVWPERPQTAAAWAEVDRNRSENYKYQRWVAEEDDRVVGFASYSQGPAAYPPRSVYVNVEVTPQYQRRGIGAALYDRAVLGLTELRPTALRADAFSHQPQGFAFLQKRGFYEAFRETPVHLDVAAFEPGPYAGLEDQLRAGGIEIKTLRELESDPDRNRKLYRLYWETSEDVPHEGEGEKWPDFDEWVSWGVNDPVILPDAYFVALHGDRYVGLRELGKYPDSDQLMGGLLGVRREYRQRGIGLAMQVRGIVYAKENGYHQLKTCTAVQNAPMQALFNKLGYVRDPEWQQCQKDLGA